MVGEAFYHELLGFGAVTGDSGGPLVVVEFHEPGRKRRSGVMVRQVVQELAGVLRSSVPEQWVCQERHGEGWV